MGYCDDYKWSLLCVACIIRCYIIFLAPVFGTVFVISEANTHGSSPFRIENILGTLIVFSEYSQIFFNHGFLSAQNFLNWRSLEL